MKAAADETTLGLALGQLTDVSFADGLFMFIFLVPTTCLALCYMGARCRDPSWLMRRLSSPATLFLSLGSER
jgi:hypothetical protein